MSEIERMQRYIERTPTGRSDKYCLVHSELLELMKIGQASADDLFNAVDLAFNYGKAKGYRAAKAERRAAV